MSTPATPSPPARLDVVLAVVLFGAALAFHAWGMSVGWTSRNLPGVEYRQAQTALSTYFIQQDGRFDLAYPTPVLGKPWSVPMEFPLYQWTVVVTSELTGLGLTKAGRAVSMACFYLMLPAVFLLLARWGVAPGRRWLVLAVVVSCPFYIFYGRAFLIETMALLCALWFWVAFERAVAGRHRGWLAVAAVAGAGAGLIKVTTLLLYLLPAAVWAARRLHAGRHDGRWRGDLRWMAVAVIGPVLVTGWWIVQADRIKALNPMAVFLSSENLRDFNLGTVATHLSPELWALKLRILQEQLTALPLLVAAGLLLLLGARHRWLAAGGCLLAFASALAMFPVLYAYHDYYYVANTLLLLLAVGLGVVGLTEVRRFRWLGLAWALVLCGGQAWYYLGHYYPDQQGISPGGNGLSEALNVLTRPDEVLVITGQDWNSMTPFYARRRALMLRAGAEHDEPGIEAALAQLAGEKIGALVVQGKPWREVFFLVRKLADRGLSPVPWLAWDNVWVFLPQQRWDEIVLQLDRRPIAGVAWVPGTQPPGELGGRWHPLGALSAELQGKFRSLQAVPVRILNTFEPQLQGIAGALGFSVHPWTRLVFRVPGGAHTLSADLWFTPGAYQVAPGQDATDGVGITLLTRTAGREPRTLGRIVADPADRAGDGGIVPLHFPFTLEQDGEVELVFDPGPQGRDTRDWLWIRGPLVIK